LIIFQDFSWDEQGFSVMSRFYADMSLLLDDKFRTAKHMTYNYMGDTRSVDTSPFRRAVWNYSQVSCLPHQSSPSNKML
jgi:hypothetical protein